MWKKFLFPAIVLLFYSCEFEYKDIPRDSLTFSNAQLCASSTLSLTLGTATGTTGCGKTDGSITVNASGGTAPYQYSLNGGAKQSSNVFSNLAGGTYSITVYDANPCSFTLGNIAISVSGSTLAAHTSITNNTGCLSPNGAVTLSATGGTAPYTYSFNSSAFSSTTSYSGLNAGTYTGAIKDNAGCSVSVSIVVGNGTSSITYTNFLKAIISNDCSFPSCHQPGNTAPPTDLSTYQLCVKNAAQIASKTADGSMPKAPHAGTLTADQIKEIACWANGGTPQ